MSRSGPVVLAAAAAAVAACTYSFAVPETAQISCSDGGAPCPDGWHCEATAGRCVVNGSVVEIPEVRVQPAGPVATTENGGAALLAIALGATPTADVNVLVSSTRTSEATVFPPELTFTAANWNQAQTVTVTGVRDQVVDGDQAYEVVLSKPVTADARFGALSELRIPGTNADSDQAQIVTVPTSVTTSESDTPATPTPIQVYLSSRPSDVVVVPVASSDPGEATVSPGSLAFDTGNWSTPQVLLAVGVDDPSPIADGRHPYRLDLGPATSTDTHFNGATTSVAGINVDNDSPGVRINPSTGLRTYESNGPTYAYVSLFTQPASDVTITFTSLNTDQVVVDPATRVLTFDAGNWDQAQWVAINPVDDPYDEIPDDAPWTVQSSDAVSSDPNYTGMVVDDVTGINTDDERSGLLFDGNPFGDFNAYENEAPRQIRVTLSSRPHGAVTVRPASSNSARLQVSPSTFTLDQSTWSTGVVMTVAPVDDTQREPDQYVDVTFSVSAALPGQDPGYDDPSISPLEVYLQDDERIIFTLSTGHTGDFTDPGGGIFYELDSLCTSDPAQGQQLFYTSAALLAGDNPSWGFERIASVSSNEGDGQLNWVLWAGRNYISETRTGPVIGRANAKGLFDFPLAGALTAAGDAWTGLEADWTLSVENCVNWTDSGAAISGRTGTSGATSSAAIAGGAPGCDGPRRLLCVEQY